MKLQFLLVVVALVVGLGIAAAAMSLGSGNPHPSALDRPPTAGDSISPTAARSLNIPEGESRKIGSWTDSSGILRRLFVATSNGLPRSGSSEPVMCLILQAPDGSHGGGCNPTNDFFAGHALVWSAFKLIDPGSHVMHSFLAGVATAGVQKVDILDSAGRSARLSVTSDGGFFREIPRSDVDEGVETVALVALNGDGRAVERLTISH